MPTLVLAGGEEFLPGAEAMDHPLLLAAGYEQPRVLIVPTAAVPENADRAAENGVRYFQRLGAQATVLPIYEPAHAGSLDRITPIRGADVVYFTGGSPTYLLSVLQGSVMLEELRAALQRGTAIGGSSAGAMVMGAFMRMPRDGQWTAATRLAGDIAVLPHHERADARTVAEGLRRGTLPENLLVLGIDGKTACLGEPGRWQVVGKGRVTVYHGGRTTTVAAGGQIAG